MADISSWCLFVECCIGILFDISEQPLVVTLMAKKSAPNYIKIEYLVFAKGIGHVENCASEYMYKFN